MILRESLSGFQESCSGFRENPYQEDSVLRENPFQYFERTCSGFQKSPFGIPRASKVSREDSERVLLRILWVLIFGFLGFHNQNSGRKLFRISKKYFLEFRENPLHDSERFPFWILKKSLSLIQENPSSFQEVLSASFTGFRGNPFEDSEVLLLMISRESLSGFQYRIH